MKEAKLQKKEYLDLHSLSDFPLTYRLSWMHLCTKKVCLVRVRGPGGRYDIGVGGETEVVSARGRGSGGHGFISGAGETELQLQWQRYTFQSDLIDGSGSISALISGNLAEKMVSMTTEHIFDLTCVEVKRLSTSQILLESSDALPESSSSGSKIESSTPAKGLKRLVYLVVGSDSSYFGQQLDFQISNLQSCLGAELLIKM
ncbi:hypothetical protein KY289_026715 [Solanum tuberosum]|nr:hypothetical protein KY289_026715 [Solanum tuberosum]